MKIPLIETNKKNRHLKLNNGVLSFREKAYSGIVNEFYVDGNIKSKSEYYQGKRQGFFNGWYRNGSEWFQRFYNKGLKSDIHIGWHTNGKQMFEYHFNTNGRYDGSSKSGMQKGLWPSILILLME